MGVLSLRETITFPVIILALTAFTLGCTKAQSSTSSKLNVATSFYAMYDFTAKIGGDRINVTNLCPSGVDPHDYDPTPKDIINMEKADVLVCNGAQMESWLPAVTNAAKTGKEIIVIASKGITYMANKDPEEKMDFNPHTWLYPLNAIKELGNIRDGLIEADPAGKAIYTSNYNYYSNQFTSLDTDFKAAVSKFKRKDLVVSHQAYDYLCKAYGLNQLAVEGVAAETEPSAADMARIENFIKKNHVKAIFGEELLSPKIEQTLAHDTGITNIELNPLEGLSDAEISAGKEYISIMKDNLDRIKLALD